MSRCYNRPKFIGANKTYAVLSHHLIIFLVITWLVLVLPLLMGRATPMRVRPAVLLVLQSLVKSLSHAHTDACVAFGLIVATMHGGLKGRSFTSLPSFDDSAPIEASTEFAAAMPGVLRY